MDKLLTALGLMSGTSLDGIDASILVSNGENIIDIKKNYYMPYKKDLKKRLENYIESIEDIDDIKSSQKEYDKLERDLTIEHSNISKKIIKESQIKIDIIGFHGQTVIHKPKKKYSIQMGDGNLLSKLLKTKVVFNFRKKDIEKGGEGAPLTPIYHYKISKMLKIPEPNIFLNIGGITNYTYISDENFKAKDIGPGNILMDKYIKTKKKSSFDFNGEIANKGNINFNLINQFIEHEFYQNKKKHSYDREDFDFLFVKGLKFEDGMATLNYFTAKIISEYISDTFKNKVNIILCGGGRKNKTLIKNLSSLINLKIKKIDDYGLDGDFVESQAFAYLSIRSLLKKNISFPDTTKIYKPSTGGELSNISI